MLQNSGLSPDRLGAIWNQAGSAALPFPGEFAQVSHKDGFVNQRDFCLILSQLGAELRLDLEQLSQVLGFPPEKISSSQTNSLTTPGQVSHLQANNPFSQVPVLSNRNERSSSIQSLVNSNHTPAMTPVSSTQPQYADGLNEYSASQSSPVFQNIAPSERQPAIQAENQFLHHQQDIQVVSPSTKLSVDHSYLPETNKDSEGLQVAGNSPSISIARTASIQRDLEGLQIVNSPNVAVLQSPVLSSRDSRYDDTLPEVFSKEPMQLQASTSSSQSFVASRPQTRSDIYEIEGRKVPTAESMAELKIILDRQALHVKSKRGSVGSIFRKIGNKPKKEPSGVSLDVLGAALEEVAEEGNLDLVEALFYIGADISYNHQGAIVKAANNGHVDVVGLLLQNGANFPDLEPKNPSTTKQDRFINQFRPIDYALINAVYHNHGKLAMRLLVNHGADWRVGAWPDSPSFTEDYRWRKPNMKDEKVFQRSVIRGILTMKDEKMAKELFQAIMKCPTFDMFIPVTLYTTRGLYKHIKGEQWAHKCKEKPTDCTLEVFRADSVLTSCIDYGRVDLVQELIKDSRFDTLASKNSGRRRYPFAIPTAIRVTYPTDIKSSTWKEYPEESFQVFMTLLKKGLVISPDGLSDPFVHVKMEMHTSPRVTFSSQDFVWEEMFGKITFSLKKWIPDYIISDLQNYGQPITTLGKMIPGASSIGVAFVLQHEKIALNEKVAILLRENGPRYEFTALTWAIIWNRIDTVNILLDKGAAAFEQSFSNLKLATTLQGSTKILSTLLERSESLQHMDIALQYAICQGHVEHVKVLVNHLSKIWTKDFTEVAPFTQKRVLQWAMVSNRTTNQNSASYNKEQEAYASMLDSLINLVYQFKLSVSGPQILVMAGAYNESVGLGYMVLHKVVKTEDFETANSLKRFNEKTYEFAKEIVGSSTPPTGWVKYASDLKQRNSGSTKPIGEQ
jgi:ankyrin repeat protein